MCNDSKHPEDLILKFLEDIYEKPIAHFTLPFSHAHLRQIETVSNYYTSLFQNVVFYTHNNFEIDVFTDTFKDFDSKENNSNRIIDKELSGRSFLQQMTLKKIISELDLDFIDFSRYRFLPANPANQIQFPLKFVENKKEQPLENKIPFFSQSDKSFDEMDEKERLESFEYLKKQYTFNENLLYLYKFDEFSSAILDTYPIVGSGKKDRIKIRIKANNPVWQQMIKINIFRNHRSGDVFFANIKNRQNNLLSSITQLISPPEVHELEGDDFMAVINRLNRYMQKSSYTSILLMIDCLRTKEDTEFINYLLETPLFADITLICFDMFCQTLEFDLELNEKPENLLRKYLLFDFPKERNHLESTETHLIKFISILPPPVTLNRLEKLLNPEQVFALKRLIKTRILKFDSGKIYPGDDLSPLYSKISKEEERNLLEPLLENPAAKYLGVELKYFLITGQWEQLKNALNSILKGDRKFEVDIAVIKGILMGNYHLLNKEMDIELLEILIAILVEQCEFETAKEIIRNCDSTEDSLLIKLKLIHICKWEKEYQRMDELLKEIEKKNFLKTESHFNDEYHYYRFVYHEIVSGPGGHLADLHRKKIKSELYRQRASILFSDRFFFKGDYKKVESLLLKAATYFHQMNLSADEIETRSHLAKLLREKKKWQEAEKLYQNLFIKSEIKNYQLISAYIAIDLGNLYWNREEINASEAWYNKALKKFQQQKNPNGIILAKSNLVEVNKIKGNWNESKKHLETILTYNKERHAVISTAIDYFNISHLEYLKHRFKQAGKIVEIARSMFQKNSNLNFVCECEILKLKIAFLENAPEKMDKIDLSFFQQDSNRLKSGSDLEISASVFEIAMKDSSNKKGRLVLDKLKEIKSKALQYEVLSLIIVKYKKKSYLNLLKSISSQLSKEDKNYYYYEYYYIYYSYFFNGGDIQEEEKDRFNEVYRFFQNNRRLINPIMEKYKERLEEKDSRYDIFKSAELVSGYLHWKIPEDFFNSLVNEIQNLLPVDLIRLTLYEKSIEPGNPVFDFNRSLNRRYSNIFNELTGEIITRSAYASENLELDREAVKKQYHSSEKTFYFYKNTKVVFWKLSEALFGILLLAFSGEEYRGYDFVRRHNEFLKKFASLINRFYENDYKLNRKLDFIIGESPSIKQLKEKILKVSKVDFGLLIRGESGSGKELVAKAVHLLGSREGGAFIPVNAAAIPENLLEAELFGYKKGAFTGAADNKIGLIEAAHNGTLFLDEIADLPPNLQAKLLRVLQENEIRRLGENKIRPINIRLICATNKDLKKMIREDQFREDLYFRIQDLTILVPPLRERREDIPLLVTHFLKKYGFSFPDKEGLQSIFASFKRKPWIGNVRELESNVKRLITYYPDFDIDKETEYSDDDGPGLIVARENLERKMILAALRKNNGNRSATAAGLKITRQYLLKLLKKHNIQSI